MPLFTRAEAEITRIASLILSQSYQILAQGGADWPQIGQILEFSQITFSTFWLTETKCTESDLKKIQDLSHLGPN